MNGKAIWLVSCELLDGNSHAASSEENHGSDEPRGRSYQTEVTTVAIERRLRRTAVNQVSTLATRPFTWSPITEGSLIKRIMKKRMIGSTSPLRTWEKYMMGIKGASGIMTKPAPSTIIRE